MKLPQLSLRELFLLVVIAAMGCGWWVRERRIADKERQLDKAIESNAKTEAELAERRRWLADHISSLKP